MSVEEEDRSKIGETRSGGVDAVDRALKILASFSEASPRQTLTELSAVTGFYKSTLLRLAISLEHSGFLRREADKSFVLGPELFRLGAVYQRSIRIEPAVRDVLYRLRESSGESASFFQRVGDSRLCLYREDSTHSIREHVREGDMLPIDKGSAGHILLHFGAGADEKQRRKVFARLPIATFGERDAGAASISAPIFGAGDVLLGALSISGPRSRLTRERIRELCESLVTAARELSEKLGGGACWRDKA